MWTAAAYGVTCHALFMLGVGAMIAMMYYGMSRSFGLLTFRFAIFANALLLLQFPLVHSWLMTKAGQTVLGKMAPRAIRSDIATTLYAIVASVQVGMLFLGWSPTGIIWWQGEGPARIALTLLYASSWLLLLKAIFDAGFAQQTGLLGWRAVFRGKKAEYPPMPKSGLFRLSRQPIYVAFALTLWTVPTWTPDQLAVALTLTVYCLVGPLFKEARFQRRFGQEFEDYRQRVPYWIPWLRSMPIAAPAKALKKNDLSIYETFGDQWWDGRTRWLRTLQNLVPARLKLFDTIMADWKGRAVLDLGCGGGFLTEALAHRGAIMVGVDPSAAAIEAAKIHAARNNLQIDYDVGAGERIPFVDKSFDVVICVDVLEHVQNLEGVIAEIVRVLRPGGLFLFDTINRSWLATFIMVTLGENLLRILPKDTHDPGLFIKPAELSALLVKVGFRMGKLQGLGPRWFDHRFDLTFGRYPTTTVMYLGSARLKA